MPHPSFLDPIIKLELNSLVHHKPIWIPQHPLIHHEKLSQTVLLNFTHEAILNRIKDDKNIINTYYSAYCSLGSY